MVERFVYTEDVGSSSLSSPTTILPAMSCTYKHTTCCVFRLCRPSAALNARIARDPSRSSEAQHQPVVQAGSVQPLCVLLCAGRDRCRDAGHDERERPRVYQIPVLWVTPDRRLSAPRGQTGDQQRGDVRQHRTAPFFPSGQNAEEGILRSSRQKIGNLNPELGTH